MADSLFSSIVNDASAVSGLDLLKIMKDEHGELAKTEYVQPALVTVSYGIYRMLERDLPGLTVSGMVGLSLGEYAALLASKAMDFTAGMKLLVDRAKYMQADADKVDSTLAAILNPDIVAVKDFCQRDAATGHQVYIANYNSPAQLVIGGVTADVQAAAAKIKDQGLAKRAVVLKVNGAFHTPLFNGARSKMHDRLQDVRFNEPVVPVISNTTVTPFTVKTIRSVLARQLAVPTHFGDDLQYLIDHQQIDATLEIGPGKTLTRFAKQVNRQLKTNHIAGLNDYQTFVKEYQDGAQK